MENNKKNKKIFSDETTEFRVLRKKKKAFIIEDDDLKSLQDTREFRKIETIDGKLISRYSPNIERGLTLDQVQKRRDDGITNKTKNKYDKSIAQIIIKNFCTFLNLLLFSIFALMLISGVEGISNYFFMVIISSNLIIGIAQEIRAKMVIDKLSLETKTKVKVIRNGVKVEVDSEDIVLDDIYYLSSGQKIVADSMVIDGSVEVNESLLTGESLPVKKNKEDIVFAGSFVSSGSCICKVERVGDANYITQLQERAKREKKNNSVILKSLNIIIGVISMCIIPFGIFNFISKWAAQGWVKDWLIIKEIITNSCGSMIAMIPSGLYLTVSVALVVSVMTLAKKRTLVQDSYAIEMLARTDVLCLDKTGTITDGTMELHEEISLSEEGKKEIYVSLVGELLGAFEEKNQTSQAILAVHSNSNRYEVETKLPFSSSRKMSAVKFKDLGTFVIGAPEFVLTPDHVIVGKLEEYTKQGYRVLLLGKGEDLTEDSVVGEIIPLRAYIIKDHIRETANETLKWFKDNGVEIKIISGDNPLTVSEIAKQAGVDNADNYVSLEGMSLEEVSEAATKYTVFGRVAPEQKATLVTSLKKAGKTVAMTGDGVNDILALKISDCSIAMASGSEAARNVSSIVLMDSDFSCLPHVVSEGRRVINNITEVASLFLMKTIFAFLLTLSTKYPFEPSNLMVIEVFCSGLASTALALQPNNRQIKGGFLRNVLSKAVPGGFTYALGVFIIVLFLENNVFGVNPTGVSTLDPISLQQTVGGLYLSSLGILTLFYHCKPLNKYRSIVFGIMTVATLTVCFTPLGEGFAHFYINKLIIQQWMLYGIALICGVIIFIGSKKLFDIFIKKYEKRKKN